MTTLEDLYYGNISPHERYIKKGTRVDKLVKLICKNEDELTAGLTEKMRINKIIKNADIVKEISDHYFTGCYQMRNEWMVDR